MLLLFSLFFVTLAKIISMNKPELIPNPDGTWTLDYPIRPLRPSAVAETERVESLARSALKRCPWDFGASSMLSDLLAEREEVEEACQVRFDALQRALELINDEDIVVDWNDRQCRNMIELMGQSAVDHFWIQDFEMCAAICETTLEADPEDHTGLVPYMLYSYVLIEDWESFDERLMDLDPRSIHYELLESIRDFDNGVKTEVRIDVATRQFIEPVCQQIPEWSNLLQVK